VRAEVAAFVAEPLPDEVRRAIARVAAAPDVVRVALMPDVHLAEEVCVGAVIATRATLYPAAVGGDIGCGMLAVGFDVDAAAVDEVRAARLLAGLYERVPRDRHLRGGPVAPFVDDGVALSHAPLARRAARQGQLQLGTLGSGNHFVELQADEEDRLWLMVHSGSRSLGPAIRAHHGRGRPGLVGLAADSDAGRAYLGDVAFALAWAEANRQRIADAACDLVAEILGGRAGARTSCHHNHVRREGELWVHRKGAIPAAEGEPGIIPGSMGTASFHTVGRGHPGALASSSHGAGRVGSRAAARRSISVRTLERELRGVYWDHRRADALRDEAPSAYKDIGQVMRAQAELTRVVRRLRPLLAYKGA
jgi:tRNA-splicing ligase RtcB